MRFSKFCCRPLLSCTIVLALTAVGTSQVISNASRPETAHAVSERFVPVQDGRLYYESCGSGGETVVLLHDGVVDSAVFDDVWPTFCSHFRTIRYDRRGYGRSPVAISGYSELDDLLAILRYAHADRVVLVGCSHGGQLSLDFTLAHRDRVRQLVLVGPVLGGLPFTEQFLTRANHAFSLLKTNLSAAISEWSSDRYLIAPGNQKARQRLRDLLIANPQDMTHTDLPLPVRPALGRLNDIAVPTLIITGAEDIPDVQAHAGAIEAGISGSRRILISDAGHLLYLEKPEEFSRIVINFLELNAP